MWDGEARRFAADRITEIQALDHTILAEIRAGLAAGCAQVTIWLGVDRVDAPAEWFQHAATNFRFDVAGGWIIGPDGSGYAIAAIDPVNAAKSPTPTGLPGRPSKGRDLIEYEFKRRCGTGEAKAALDEEAEALRGWYIMSYPQAQHPTVKTIKNNIRADHRRWVAGQRQSGGA